MEARNNPPLAKIRLLGSLFTDHLRRSMKTPKITVLMAVLNGEKVLRRTIESVLNQTFQDFEFLIINDCSTDRTVDVISSYKDGRIINHTNKENIGQINSLNKGLLRARGEYIARLDADDISFPDRLEKQYNFLKRHPRYALVGSAGVMVDTNYKRIGLVMRPTSYEGVLKRMFFGSPLIHVSILVNRKVLLSCNGYDSGFPLCADYDLWLRMISKRHKLVSLRDILVQYVVDNNSQGSKDKETKNVEENGTIRKCAIETMLGLTVTLEETNRLSKYLLLGPHSIKEEDRLSVERLIMEVAGALKAKFRLAMPDKEMSRFLSRCYLKSCLYYLENKEILKARELLLSSASRNGLELYSSLALMLTYFNKTTIKMTMDQANKVRVLHDVMMRLSLKFGPG